MQRRKGGFAGGVGGQMGGGEVREDGRDGYDGAALRGVSRLGEDGREED